MLSTRAWLADRGEIRVPANNRMLVEAATNHAALIAFAEDLGDPWPGHLWDVAGKIAAKGGAARIVSVDWGSPLVENQPVPNERATTRLGLDDRRVELPQALPGPFGEPVRTLNVPGWMASDAPADAAAADLSARSGEILFRLGSETFRYDRLGLSTVTA